MARFRRPEDALRAAVCMQQLFARERERDPAFKLRVRIGIHTGKALVEQNDVYGDAVNIASRVESKAKGDEVLVSGSTAMRLSNNQCKLSRKERFQPKGKTSAITTYRCNWKNWEDLTWVYRHDRLPLAPRQKLELLGFVAAGLASLYFIYQRYLRFVLADSPEVALFYLDPLKVLQSQPWTLLPTGAVLLASVVFFLSIRSLSHVMLRLIKGGFGLAAAFAVAWLVTANLDLPVERGWSDILHRSEHLFVRVAVDDAPVHRRPDAGSEVLRRLQSGELLLLADVHKGKESTWNKVLIANSSYGWIERVAPARIGEPSRRVTWTDKFYFRWRDLYVLGLALVGFLWGFLNFRLRPL